MAHVAAEVRLQLAQALLACEVNYLKQTQYCLKNYLKPMENQQIINQITINKIFGNMEQIFEFTKQQCAAIRDRVTQWNEWQSVADIFAFSAELWSDLYRTYLLGYLSALRTIQSQEQSNRRFAQFLGEKRRTGADHSLLDGIVLPLEQLSRYHVLLCQLLRRTDGSHPDFANLEAAVDSVNILVAELDEACTPLIRFNARAGQTKRLVAALEREGVPLDATREAIVRASNGSQKMISGYLPGREGGTPTVPHDGAQLEALHTALTDIETVLTQLRHKQGALQRVRQSGLPAALDARFREQAANLDALFDQVFGDALLSTPQPQRAQARPPHAHAGRGRGAARGASPRGGKVAAAQAGVAAALAGGPPRRGGRGRGAGRAAVPLNRANSVAFHPKAGLPRQSMLSSSGAASLIDDEEGQLMWSEAFGPGARSCTVQQLFAALSRYLNQPLNDNEKHLLNYVINMGVEAPQIDVELFAGFLRGFGPLTSCLTNVKAVLASKWFYGFIAHSEAIRLLETEQIGTYLVRFSLSKPGSFALEATILDADGQPFVLPIQINPTPDGGCAIHESDAGDREFATLHELISYYTAYLLQPLSSTIPFEEWFHGEISSQEATAKLQSQPDGTFLLRFSSRPGCYASSFVENGAVRHALILSVDGGYCVEGDATVYPTVPALVKGFNAGLQQPLRNAEHHLKKRMFALAKQEFEKESEAQGNDTIDLSSSWDQNNSYLDPADQRTNTALMSRESVAAWSTSAQTRPAASLPDIAASKPAAKLPTRAPAVDTTLDDEEGGELVFMPDGKNIKGGTLEGLVEHLLENTASKFAKCFLLTYNSFTTPVALLAMLQRRYTYFCNHDGASIESKKLRLRICNFLKSWSQKHFASKQVHEDDQACQQAYTQFADKHVRPMDGDSLANQLVKALNKALDARHAAFQDTSSGAAPFVFSSKPPKPELPKKFDSGEWHWSDVSATEIARQMTLIEEECFRSITPNELLGLAWTKKDKEKRSPNLLKLIARFNQVHDWVKSSIIQERDLKKRAKIYEKFVEISVQLGKLNNYNAVMEISSALESASVFRLKKTKAKISQKLMNKYEVLHAKVNRAQSYKALREAIHSSNPPVIPYFGMYQSDLTFIEEGNPDFLRDTDPPLINFHKRRLIAQVINDEIQQYQQAPYNLQKVPVLADRLELALTTDIVDDDTCYKISLEVEPRE